MVLNFDQAAASLFAGLARTRCGLPTTVTLSGISVITTVPAPIITLLPILMPCRITALAPTKVPLPIFTFPQRTAPGAICEKSPNTHSWSIVDEVLQITPLPIYDRGLMVAFAAIITPFSIFTDADITALGCIALIGLPINSCN